MSPGAQRIAIAEACGYRKKSGKRRLWTFPRTYVEFCVGGLPDYLNDLNAIHSACRTLTTTNKIRFNLHLDKIAKRPADNAGEDFDYVVTLASAGQRAEAFLRTLGKWTP